MNPYVKSVQPQENYCLLLTFENGEKRIFDLKPYLDKGVFMRLQNEALFKTARVVSGSVEWYGEIDLSYDTLYLSSIPVKPSKGKSKTFQKAKKKIATIPAKRKKQARASVEAK
ncbi:MAG: DUF2442 domain-containing protein [Anaerolineae bacterium]|nr:DUF2442 domain-containing protein [Anaerolineae bacterium]MCI0607504.1 DUF2442 domain-containing protein [Anaerolineae bacterium]